jgi:hypothetical protein
MLGDQIGEEKGKISSQRVLGVEAGMPKMELFLEHIDIPYIPTV